MAEISFCLFLQIFLFNDTIADNVWKPFSLLQNIIKNNIKAYDVNINIY